MSVLEDELHAETQADVATFEGAVAECERRAAIAWDQDPNVAPCLSWRTCGRRYEIIEYDASRPPWHEIRRVPALEVSAKGAKWLLPQTQGGIDAQGA